MKTPLTVRPGVTMPRSTFPSRRLTRILRTLLPWLVCASFPSRGQVPGTAALADVGPSPGQVEGLEDVSVSDLFQLRGRPMFHVRTSSGLCLAWIEQQDGRHELSWYHFAPPRDSDGGT